MSRATEQKEVDDVPCELEQPIWSVVSFDKCEAAGLAYPAAVKLMAELEASGVYGLCIVTDAAAKRISTKN